MVDCFAARATETVWALMLLNAMQVTVQCDMAAA